MKRITKNGPQLTAAQAIDFILYTLDIWLRHKEKTKDVDVTSPYLDHIALGECIAYGQVYDFVEAIRDEKFDAPKTANTYEVVAKSR